MTIHISPEYVPSGAANPAKFRYKRATPTRQIKRLNKHPAPSFLHTIKQLNTHY